MAELHESIIRTFRKRFLSRGFKEAKSPIATFLPDFFAQKQGRNSGILQQVVVEAEIQSTLFKPHTAEQLILMDEYIRLMRRKRVTVLGFLLVPNRYQTKLQAKLLISSLFPQGTSILIKYGNEK